MTLEQLIGKEAVQEIRGRNFGIDPSIKYDPSSKEVREKFVESAGDLFDVEEYYTKLRENSGDIGTLNDLTQLALKYMGGDRETNTAIMRDPNKALQQADLLLGTGYISMAKFIENSRDKIFDTLSAEQIFSLIEGLHPQFCYKTGDAEHDRITLLKHKMSKIQQTAQEKKDIGSAIQGELGELIKMMPKEQRAFLEENSEAYIQSLKNSILGKIQQAYQALFRTADGKALDKSALRKYLEDNYKFIKDAMNKKDRPDKEKAKIWDKNLKPQYVEIARVLHGLEKSVEDRDRNEAEYDRKKQDRKEGIIR